MENAITLAAIMGPMYLLLGLSLLLHVNAWQKLMESWRKDHFGLFTMMFFSAILGLIAINMYNVWEWNVWLLVTITGWGMLLKGIVYLLAPGSILKTILSWKKSTSILYFSAVVTLAIGAALTYYTYYA